MYACTKYPIYIFDSLLLEKMTNSKGIILMMRFMGTRHTGKSLQSCPTLCDSIDGLLPGSSVPGILQERTLEWVAISFSNAWKWKVNVKSLSPVRLLATPWTAAHQAPPSMGFSRQEYSSGLHCLLVNMRTSLFFTLFFILKLLYWGMTQYELFILGVFHLLNL